MAWPTNNQVDNWGNSGYTKKVICFTMKVVSMATKSSLSPLLMGVVLSSGAFFLSPPISSAADNVAYISSSSGYVLHRNSANVAVTANWNGQAPIVGFSGYGQIRMDGLCLTGAPQSGPGPLTWEPCRNIPAQRWGLVNTNQPNKLLRNEGGWCADVEGNAAGAGVRVLAFTCSGVVNQLWKAHLTQNAQPIINKITDPNIRSSITNKVNVTRPTVVTLTPSEAQQLVAQGGGNLVAQGGGTFTQKANQLVATGGGNVMVLNPK